MTESLWDIRNDDGSPAGIDESGLFGKSPALIPSVEHEDDCGFFHDEGCSCEPEVVFLPVPSEKLGDSVLIVSAQHRASCESHVGGRCDCLPQTVSHALSSS